MFNFNKVDLISLTQKNDYNNIEKIIKTVNVNFRDKDKKTALFYAVENSNLDICKLLIKNGADMYIRDDRGMMAIHYAILLSNNKVIDYFYKENFKYSKSQISKECKSMTLEDNRRFLKFIKKFF